MPNLPFVGYWAHGGSDTSLKTAFQVTHPPFCYMADVSFPSAPWMRAKSRFVYCTVTGQGEPRVWTPYRASSKFIWIQGTENTEILCQEGTLTHHKVLFTHVSTNFRSAQRTATKQGKQYQNQLASSHHRFSHDTSQPDQQGDGHFDLQKLRNRFRVGSLARQPFHLRFGYVNIGIRAFTPYFKTS